MSDDPIRPGPDQDDDDDPVLDLTTERVDSGKAPSVEGKLAEKLADTRRLIAIWLLVGLAAIAVWRGALGIWGDAGDIAGSSEALANVFTGFLGLTATAVGFYFGSSSGANRG